MHAVGAFLFFSFFLVHGRILLEQCHRRLTESINEVTPTVWPLLECAGIPKSAAHLNEVQSVDVAVLNNSPLNKTIFFFLVNNFFFKIDVFTGLKSKR